MKTKRIFLVILACMLTFAMFASCTEKEVDGWAYVKEKGELIIGLDATFEPMGFTDENGNIIGFDIDLANEILPDLEGIKLKFQPIEWSAKETELSSKRIDAIWNGMSVTPERKEKMELTNAYFNNSIIVVGKDVSALTDIDSLKGKKLGVQAESSALEILQKTAVYEDIKADVQEYPDYAEVQLALNAGRIEFIVVDSVYFESTNAKLSDDEKLTPASFTLGDDLYAIGCRKGEKTLVDKLNAALKKVIESGKASELSVKWCEKDLIVK
ncbi:polar amino acid ABC transporter substrate-binding protein [Clostridia bacterium]|nr:polar amino acid ABC transporter substrate-binding protein [Clostridia bacterium]